MKTPSTKLSNLTIELRDIAYEESAGCDIEQFCQPVEKVLPGRAIRVTEHLESNQRNLIDRAQHLQEATPSGCHDDDCWICKAYEPIWESQD